MRRAAIVFCLIGLLAAGAVFFFVLRSPAEAPPFRQTLRESRALLPGFRIDPSARISANARLDFRAWKGETPEPLGADVRGEIGPRGSVLRIGLWRGDARLEWRQISSGRNLFIEADGRWYRAWPGPAGWRDAVEVLAPERFLDFWQAIPADPRQVSSAARDGLWEYEIQLRETQQKKTLLALDPSGVLAELAAAAKTGIELIFSADTGALLEARLHLELSGREAGQLLGANRAFRGPGEAEVTYRAEDWGEPAAPSAPPFVSGKKEGSSAFRKAVSTWALQAGL